MRINGVVVIMRGGLGDIVLAQAALVALKERLGDKELCVATSPEYVDLFLSARAVDRVMIADGMRAAKRLRQRLEADGVAVYNLDHPFKGTRRELRATLHIVERLDELLATNTAAEPPRLDVVPIVRERPYGVLTWAGSADHKLPGPEDRREICSAFMEVCASAEADVFYIGESMEGAMAAPVEGSLLYKCALIRGASLYMGCDTGFSHVASTTQVPSVICHVGLPVARCGVKNPRADLLYYEDGGRVVAAAVCEALRSRGAGLPPLAEDA